LPGLESLWFPHLHARTALNARKPGAAAPRALATLAFRQPARTAVGDKRS
jgi:hypothetical protein